MKNFYLTLLGDSFLHMYPGNKQNSFTVKLDHPIQIEKELWEVALVEMITPLQILNISEKNNYFFLRFYNRNLVVIIDNAECRYDGSCSEIDFKIPKGNYHSPSHLIEEIQNIIDKRYGTMLKQSNASISIAYGKNSRRVKLNLQDSNQEDFGNANVKARNDVVARSRPVELWGRLHLDLAMQEKYLPYGIEMKIRLNRASTRFCILSEDPCVVKIYEAALEVRHIQLLLAISNELNQSIAHHNAKFLIRRVEVKSFTIGSGLRSKVEGHLFQGQLPKRIFIGMVTIQWCL